MDIIEAELKGVFLIKPKIFEDSRGYFFESYRENMLQEAGVDLNFVQDNMSKSSKNTIRGLHYQIENPQDKLVTCLVGEVLDVAVDIRKNSPTFGKCTSFVLSQSNHYSLLVPKGFAHGFSVLSDEAIISYKCSDYYNKAGERGIRWDDSEIGVDWKVSNPILSDKDKELPLFSAIQEKDLF